MKVCVLGANFPELRRFWWKPLLDMSQEVHEPNMADIVLVSRLLPEDKLVPNNIPLLYFIDDLYWKLYPQHGGRKLLISRAEKVIPRANLVVASTDFLRECLAIYFPNKKVLSLRLCLTEEKPYQAPTKLVLNMGKNAHDIDLIASGLNLLLEKLQHKYNLQIIGVSSLLKLNNYLPYNHCLSAMTHSLGLIPLKDDYSFNYAKSLLKVFEYVSRGSVCVFSHISYGDYGLLTRKIPDLVVEKDWISKVDEVWNNPQEFYEQLLSFCRNYGDYSIAKERWERVLSEI